MKPKRALEVLAKFFDCKEDVFAGVDKVKLVAWALSVGVPNYKLEHWQHQLLVNC